MLHINISQQYAKINIEPHPAELRLATSMPKVDINTKAAVVEISSGVGELSIDSSPCRYSIGLRSNAEMLQEFARDGKAMALEAIGDIAEDGDRMMHIETHEDVIVNLAAEQNVQPMPDVEWHLIDPPMISYQPRAPRYNPIPAQLDLQLIRGRVENNSVRGYVNVTMAQYGKVNIWLTGNMDMKA